MTQWLPDLVLDDFFKLKIAVKDITYVIGCDNVKWCDTSKGLRNLTTHIRVKC